MATETSDRVDDAAHDAGDRATPWDAEGDGASGGRGVGRRAARLSVWAGVLVVAAAVAAVVWRSFHPRRGC